MKNYRLPLLFSVTAIAALLVAAGPISAAFQEPGEVQDPTEEEAKPKVSKALKLIGESEAVYVGASKCKSCHNKESAGEIYDKWGEMAHANAFKALKSDEALAIGKERGIKVPSEAAECMKCHDTAFGMDKKKKHRRFKSDIGVQCESCHGPGSIHVKTRLTFAKENKPPAGQLLVIPENEMILPDQLLCQSCHNDESPSYKEFKFGERLEEIRHLHPQREKPRVVPPKKKKGEGEEGEEGEAVVESDG
jgi:hypothetical protein